MSVDRQEWDAYIAAHAKTPVTLKLIGHLFGILIDALKQRDHRTTTHEARIAALEAHLAKGGPAVTWVGTYQLNRQYHAGDLVTRKGLWLCTSSTNAKPEDQRNCWKLICKERP